MAFIDRICRDNVQTSETHIAHSDTGEIFVCLITRFDLLAYQKRIPNLLYAFLL